MYNNGLFTFDISGVHQELVKGGTEDNTVIPPQITHKALVNCAHAYLPWFAPRQILFTSCKCHPREGSVPFSLRDFCSRKVA